MTKKNFFRMTRLSPEDLNVQNTESYYSCEELEGAVSLVFSKLTMCGFMHSVTKGMPNICEYNGEEIDPKVIVDARRKLIEKNQSEEDTPCKGCQFLQKKIWPKKENLITHITVGHYSICNLRCTYCYITDYTKEQQKLYFSPPYSAANALNSMFTQNLVSKNATAWLTAGEPTLFDEFSEIMKILLDNECLITIGTNCIKSFEIIEEGLSKGLVEILCSVDSGTREKYIEIKGKDRFDNVWNTLSRYVKIDPDLVIVKYIFTDQNSSCSEVFEFIKLCELTGVKKISISRDILSYSGILSSKKIRMPNLHYESISFLMTEAVKRGIRVYFDINWPVFSDEELQEISMLTLAKLKKEDYVVDDITYALYFKKYINKVL